MPVVHVHIWEGFTQTKINELIKGITEVFTKMGIPQQAVEVLIHEVPKSHWGINGKPATESLKDAKVPE